MYCFVTRYMALWPRRDVEISSRMGRYDVAVDDPDDRGSDGTESSRWAVEVSN